MIKTIRAKIIWAFSILVLLNLATGFWSIYNFYALGTTVSTILHDNYQNVLAAENMMKYLERQDNALLASSEELDYAGWEDSTSGGWDDRTARSRQDLDENRQYFDYWHMQVERSVLLPEQETLRDSILTVYDEYSQRADSMMARTYQGAFDKAKQYYYSRVRPMSDVLRQLCFRLFEINQAAMHNAVPATHQVASQIAYGTMVTSIITLLLGIIAAVWLTKVFITPAENLTQTVKQIGAGKLDLKIDVLSDDEIGQLSREFNKMTERLKRYDQMNIEQILAEKRKSEAIVEGIADGLVVTDAAMNIVHMNRVMGDLFGVTESEAVGAPVSAVIRDERLVGIIRNCYTSSGSDGESKLSALEFKGPEDQRRYFRPKTTRIVNSDGELFGVLTLLQDVTQFKELDRMKSDFIATLSHEFRTPLTSINMSIDILSQGILGELNEKQKELINAAKEDCFRLTKLARELLQLSKLESGAVQLKAEVIHIESVIDHTLRALQLQFSEKNMKLVTEVAPDIPTFIADEQQISWVITNLVTNALKYTDAGGTVTVRARQTENQLLVQVEDTGHGIPREYLESIFDKFVQVRQVAGTSPGSVGLGLAIAKEIVEMYDGRIWAESEVGKGSTFSFTLPLGKMTAAPPTGALVKSNEQESIHTAG